MAAPDHLVPIPEGVETRIGPILSAAFEAGRRRQWNDAFRHFNRVVGILIRTQKEGQRFHKGAFYHNMGLAKLFADELADARLYTLLAFLEDAQSKADEQQPPGIELAAPAAHNLVFVFGASGIWLTDLSTRVRQVVAAGEHFPDPRGLLERLDLNKVAVSFEARQRQLTEIELLTRIERRLTDNGYAVVREPEVAGLRVDLAVAGRKGLLIVEVKSIDPERPGHSLQSLSAQVQRIAQGARGAKVLGVVEDAWEGVVDAVPGVVTEAQLTASADTHAGQPADVPVAFRTPPHKPRIFASMPFGSPFEDTFFVAIRKAAQAVGAVAERVDHAPRTGDVVLRIKERIEAATIVVADLSGSRPSVLHEYGFAEALGKPVIPITSGEIRDLPFNVSHNDTYRYELGRTDALRRELTKRLRAELRRLAK